MRGHDLTNKKTMTNTKTKTMTMTKTNTFWEHLQRATLETCDLWDIWSEWWGDMTRPEKRQWQRRRQRQWEIHLETCDLWDTVYISDNWEPGFMTIFVTWQLRVTRDSIRNSCDVFSKQKPKSVMPWATFEPFHYLNVLTMHFSEWTIKLDTSANVNNC